MVELIVGPEKTLFRVHKSFICSKIDYFDKMFNGGFREASENSATFPEDDPVSFDILIEWVYTGRLRQLKLVDGTTRFNWLPSQLYQLCEKLRIPEMMDGVMDALRRCHRDNNILMGVDDIKMSCSTSQEGSGYRLYALHTLLYVFRKPGAAYKGSWPSYKIQRIISSEADLGKAFLVALRDQVGDRQVLIDPRFGDSCVYHSHKLGEKCIQKQN